MDTCVQYSCSWIQFVPCGFLGVRLYEKEVVVVLS
jgi:hypothetical protein